MASFTSTRNSRRKRQGRRRPKATSVLWKVMLGSVAGIGALAGGSYFILEDLKAAKPDKMGCYAQSGAKAYTTALIDVSEPGFDVVQRRDAVIAFTNLYSYDLAFNERFSMISTAQNRIGSVASPVVTLCGPARTQADLEEVGAADVTQVFLDKQAQLAFDRNLKPHLDTLFAVNPSDEDRQKHESPILEQIQSASRMPGFSDGAAQRHLIVVSDMLQNTRELQFCHTQGHLPSFETFKSKPYFQKVKPVSLDGTRVTIYMLIRGNLGQAPYAYCTEDELRRFWNAYFEDAGASSTDIIRLRQGGI